MQELKISAPDSRPASELVQTRKLGEYLKAAGACDETAVLYGLQRQENLRTKAYDPLIGMLLLDAGAITKKDLAQALRLQDMDRLAGSAIFQSLPRKSLAEIYARSTRQSYEPNAIIFRQQEGSDHVYVVLQGTVSLTHKPPTGREIDLAVHRTGEVFGEMSLLTESHRFVTARAMEKTGVLAVPRNVFLALYRDYPEASQAAIRRWFNAMIDGRQQSQIYQEHHYSKLLSKLDSRPCIPLIGTSKRARKLREQVDVFGAGSTAILISGEPGSMKSRMAQFIHQHGKDSEGSYIIFDPSQVSTN